MVPPSASAVFFYASVVQVHTTGMVMDATVGSTSVPPTSMSTFDVVTIVLLVPLYDRVFIPSTRSRRLTWREKGVSELKQNGAVLACL
jgi:peptide/histidine transporter 3/4